MIHKVFELEDTLVRSVMVPRPDMFCLDVATPGDRILPALREHLHSRVPVYEGTIDVIVGILYTKDLLPYAREGLPSDFDLRARLHPPYFVPESKRADALLQEVQAKKLHVAIVVDEYGGTPGRRPPRGPLGGGGGGTAAAVRPAARRPHTAGGTT